MGTDANPLDDPLDAEALLGYSTALLDAVEATLSDWVVRGVLERWRAFSAEEPPEAVLAEAAAAGDRAREEVMAELRPLLATDVDAQRGNPLAVIRRAVVHPTQVLRAAGVPAARRDADAERLFPDDPYDLSPASFADVHPSLHEPGLEWGAAKAHVVLRRRRGGPTGG